MNAIKNRIEEEIERNQELLKIYENAQKEYSWKDFLEYRLKVLELVKKEIKETGKGLMYPEHKFKLGELKGFKEGVSMGKAETLKDEIEWLENYGLNDVGTRARVKILRQKLKEIKK